MNKRVEQVINNIYKTIYKKVFDKSGTTELLKNNVQSIVNTIANIELSDEFNKYVKRVSEALAKIGIRQDKRLWRKFYEKAKQAHYIGLPRTWKDFEEKILRDAILHNFKMIRSIPQSVLKLVEYDYANILIKEVAEGKLSRGAFERKMAEHGHKNAKLIARTETAKLQTAILENRALNLGSVAYEWLSSNDKRTRKSHRAMNGVIVFWRQDSEKPLLDNMRGNAGEFPNCRCTPQPLFDVDDLTKSYYKIYDYRTDTVHTINRSNLLNALEKGAL